MMAEDVARWQVLGAKCPLVCGVEWGGAYERGIAKACLKLQERCKLSWLPTLATDVCRFWADMDKWDLNGQVSTNVGGAQGPEATCPFNNSSAETRRAGGLAGLPSQCHGAVTAMGLVGSATGGILRRRKVTCLSGDLHPIRVIIKNKRTGDRESRRISTGCSRHVYLPAAS